MILDENASARLKYLAKLWSYFKGTAYAHLVRSFDDATDNVGHAIPFRSRRPSVVVPILRLCVNTFVSSLWFKSQRPMASLAGQSGTEDNDALAALIAEAGVYRAMRESSAHALAMGSGCIVWEVLDGKVRTHAWDPKHCEPTFRPGRFPELERITLCLQTQREVTDPATGRTDTRAYWHRETIDANRWVRYRPEPVTDHAPKWVEDHAHTVEHGLGFVPAVWFIVGDPGKFEPDGTSMYDDLLTLVDELNYTASQAGRALGYNLDPQIILLGMSDADIGTLQKNGSTVWPLPANSDAKLLESSGEFIRVARERLDYVRKQIFDACAVVINDPEKVGGAQSGSALRHLAAPMLARLDDLREDIGTGALVPLLEQMLRVKLPNSAPTVLLSWGPLMQTSADEAKVAVDAAAAAVASGIASKAAARRWVAPYLGVTDLESDQLELDQEQLADQGRVLEQALATETLKIPSATFQRAHASRVVRTLLGKEAPAEQIAAIDRELAHNISEEEQARGDRRLDLSRLARVKEDDDVDRE